MLSFCKCVNKFLSFIVHSYVEAVYCSFLKQKFQKTHIHPMFFHCERKQKSPVESLVRMCYIIPKKHSLWNIHSMTFDWSRGGSPSAHFAQQWLFIGNFIENLAHKSLMKLFVFFFLLIYIYLQTSQNKSSLN